jgi:hypothetical protein
MYVKEPKEIVTRKIFHFQSVSEQHHLTAGRELLYLGCRKEVEQREKDVPMVHITVASL